jgi:hypothetical protein
MTVRATRVDKPERNELELLHDESLNAALPRVVAPER